MVTKHKAVIDLGSNTFHILIVDEEHKTIYRDRVFVSLAEKGIEKISDGAFKRGLDCLLDFKIKLDIHKVTRVKVVGTAALRSASNAHLFIKEVHRLTGLNIQVIEGLQEAKYIYQGIASVVPMEMGSYLIMDIGGGSVEFILVRNGQIEQSKSYNVGIGQLFSIMPHSQPLISKEKEQIKTYILDQISTLTPFLKDGDIKALVGASGSFEVLEAMYNMKVEEGKYNVLTSTQFITEAKVIYSANMEEILEMDAIPRSRAKLITLGFLLIDSILEVSKISKILVSPAAMKEGILSEL